MLYIVKLIGVYHIMKLTESMLKKIVKEELKVILENTEMDPATLLGQISMRSEQLANRIKPLERKTQDSEILDFLQDVRGELRMYSQTGFKYRK